MSRRSPLLLAAVATIAVLGSSTPVALAQTPAVLPVLPLTRLDGTTASTASMPQAGPWLLIVSLDQCPACASTLAAVSRVATPAQAARVAVVLGGVPVEQGQVMAPRLPGLAGARWFVDPARGLLPALHLSSAPLLVGLSDDAIAWTRAAAGMSDAQLRAVISSWIR